MFCNNYARALFSYHLSFIYVLTHTLFYMSVVSFSTMFCFSFGGYLYSCCRCEIIITNPGY